MNELNSVLIEGTVRGALGPEWPTMVLEHTIRKADAPDQTFTVAIDCATLPQAVQNALLTQWPKPPLHVRVIGKLVPSGAIGNARVRADHVEIVRSYHLLTGGEG